MRKILLAVCLALACGVEHASAQADVPVAEPVAEPSTAAAPEVAPGEPAAAPAPQAPPAPLPAASAPAAAPPEAAESASPFDALHIHGFGTWAAGYTTDNHYLHGSDELEFSHVHLALRQIYAPIPQFQISAGQSFLASPHDSGTDVFLDFAFAEWRFSDRLAARIGQSPLPIALYSEIFDVGTLRPFLSLPYAIYGPAGFIAKQYRGVSVRFDWESSSGWGLGAELFGGEVRTDIESPIDAVHAAEAEEEGEAHEGEAHEEEGGHLHAAAGGERISPAAGGLLRLTTPLSGLELGVGGYAGTNPQEEHLHSVVIGRVAYLADPWWVRAEFLHHSDGDHLEANACYLELAWFAFAELQLALRGEWFDTKLDEPVHGDERQLLEHISGAAGINYWFTPELVLKLAYHYVRGNRFAHPLDDELIEAVTAGRLAETTHYVEFGAAFSF